jgi:hypothetical protein
MPLFDLFKKPSKKEPAKSTSSGSSEGQKNQQNAAQQSAADNPFSSSEQNKPEQNKRRYDAAMEFLTAFQERTPLLNGKPHAGTALAVAARLAGTSLYRSLNYKKDIAPGVVVLSEEVNQAWPKLLNVFAFYCKQSGLDVMAKPMVTKFPEKDKPLMDTDQVLQEYQDQYHEIMKKHELDYLDSARAGMIVSSIIFQYHCINGKDIDPYVATGIVASGIVEGAKIAPPPLEGKPRTGTKKMSRLVLGEPDAAREEALATGSIYIEINPKALRILQQKNIDPYLIYEKGVLNQIEERIARIDFVKVDVEKLFEEWRSKSHMQAPIHVRLIIWLKNNASMYGYEQIGNSWVLK